MLLQGLYPSFYLSSFKPINVLKGQLSRGSKNSILRNGLVIFQFTTSIILIIGTLVIYNQTQYILNKKIGFDKDQVLLVQGTNTLEDKREAFKNELLKSSEIKSVSISDYLPISGTKRDGNGFYKEGKTKEDIAVSSQKWQVDYDYLKTMGMHIIEGRYFSKDMASDSAAAVINKTMAEKLGLKNPIGQRIENGWQKFTVIGVMEDFNFESMRQNVTPLCLVLGNYNSSIISVKIRVQIQKMLSVIYLMYGKAFPRTSLSVILFLMKVLQTCMQMCNAQEASLQASPYWRSSLHVLVCLRYQRLWQSNVIKRSAYVKYLVQV